MDTLSLPGIYDTVAPRDYRPDTPPELRGTGPIFLDAETDGRDWFKGGKAAGWAVHQDGQSWYLPFRHAGGGNLDESTVLRWMRQELRGKRIVNAWTKFDAHIAANDGIDFEELDCPLHDIMHAEALLDDWLQDFSLEGTAQRYLGIGKLDSGPKSEIGRRPAWDVAAYAKRDVELVARIHALQGPKLAEQDLGRVMAIEDGVLPVAVAMERNGCPLDEELLEQWVNESEQLEQELSWRIYRNVGFAVNPDRQQDMVRLWKHCGIENPHRTPPSKTYPKGQPQFRAAYVETITHPLVQDVIRLAKLKDLRSKFLIPYSTMKWNGSLWPTFHQLMTGEEGTISGRWSCVRPNVQQVLNANKFKDYSTKWGLPFNIRRLFVPASGRWFTADQEQVEYRRAVEFAYAARHKFEPAAAASAVRMKEAYDKNPELDYHDEVGTMVKVFRPGLNRTELKITNFRKLYGGQAPSIGKALGISEEEAYTLVAQYDAAFPCMKALLELAQSVAESRGYVTTVMGRRSRFPNRNERTYKALNAAIQGSSGDDIKIAMTDVHRERKRLGFTLRMTVHDELGGDLAQDADPQPLVSFLNMQRTSTHVPILWSGGTGANWAEAKG